MFLSLTFNYGNTFFVKIYYFIVYFINSIHENNLLRPTC